MITRMRCYLLFLVGVVFAISSCNRDLNENTFAASIVAVPADYTIPGGSFQTSTAQAVFSSFQGTTAGVYFLANFGRNVTWQLKIVGQTSSASKTLSGTSELLNQANSTWTGESDGGEFFRTGEVVIASLSIYGANKAYQDTLIIAQAVDYSYLNQGVLISDFNSNFVGATGGAYTPTAGTTFAQFPWITIEQLDTSFAIEGGGLVKFNGIDKTNLQFIGGVYVQNANKPNGDFTFYSDTTLHPYIDPNIDPSKMWINLFIYGYPGSSAQIDLIAKEFDPGGNANTATYGDQWRTRIELNWVGWKLVSYKYSDFYLTPNSLGGNGVRNPGNIYQFDINAGPNPNIPNTATVFLADYYIVTFNQPFKY